MLQLLYVLFFYNLFIWKPCVCVKFYPDGTQGRMAGKIKKLAAELALDAIAKINAVKHFQHQLHKDIAFQYGHLMYQMRYRHKKMFRIYSEVLRAQQTETGDNEQYVTALADVDTLAHEIMNLATMVQIHDANLHSNKNKPTYNLFFRRNNMAALWLGLLDSLDNTDNHDTPEPSPPPPEESNQTETGKRKNGVWHYAAPIN